MIWLLRLAPWLARLSPVGRFLVAVWRSRLGRGVLVALMALALIWAYGERRAAEAVSDAEIKRQAQDRQDTLDIIRRIDDATSQGGSVDDMRERVRRLLEGR